MAPNLNGPLTIILFQGARALSHRHSQWAQSPSPIEMLPMIKMSQKRLLFFQFQFLLASSRTTVINNNIDPEGPGPPGPLQFNFYQPIRMGPQQ